MSVLATLRFFRAFRLVFLWICVFFFKTFGLLVFGLVLIKICLYLGLFFAYFCIEDCFFYQISWPFCSFNILQNEIWACCCANLLILGLFFWIRLPVFVFN